MTLKLWGHGSPFLPFSLLPWEGGAGRRLPVVGTAGQIIVLPGSVLFTNQGHCSKEGVMSGKSIKTLADRLWKNHGVSLLPPASCLLPPPWVGWGGVRTA